MTTPEDPFAAPTEGPGSVPAYGQPAGTAPYGEPAAPAGYGQPAYGGPPPYGMPGTAPRNGLGTAALVLGILALLATVTVIGGVLLGILAVVLGAIGRGRAKRGEATNGGSALAGLICGAIAVVLSLALVAVGVSFLNSDSGKKLKDCLDNAGNDASAQQKCQVEFTDNFR